MALEEAKLKLALSELVTLLLAGVLVLLVVVVVLAVEFLFPHCSSTLSASEIILQL